LEQIADFAAANGFDGVELRTHDDGNHLAPAGGTDAARKAGEVFKRRKARVFSLMGYTNFTSEKPEELVANRDKLMRLSDMAEVLGASFIRAFVGRLPTSVSHTDVIKRAAPYMRAACQHAASKGVVIGVETHDDWCNPSVTMALVDQVGPQLGVVWDIWNASCFSGLGIDEQYRGLRGAILYCHVKDAVMTPDGGHKYVPLGQGVCDIRRALDLLRKDQPDIFLSFEHEKKWHPELPEPEVAFPHYLKVIKALNP
jgi:sugar phosphate isomerase/epimerase